MQPPPFTFALAEFYTHLLTWQRNPGDVSSLAVAGNAEVNARLAQIFCLPSAEGVDFAPDARFFAKTKLAGNLTSKENWTSASQQPQYMSYAFSLIMTRLTSPPADDPSWATLAPQAATLLAQIVEAHGFAPLTPFFPNQTPLVDCLIHMVSSPGPLRDTALRILGSITRPYGTEERLSSYFSLDRLSDGRPAVRLLPAVVPLIDPPTAASSPIAPTALQIATRLISDYEWNVASHAHGNLLPEYAEEVGGAVNDPAFAGAEMAWLEAVAAIARTQHTSKKLHEQIAAAFTAALVAPLYARWRSNKELVALAAEYTKTRLAGAVERVKTGRDEDSAGLEDLAYWDAAIAEGQPLEDIPQQLVMQFLETLVEGLTATDSVLENELDAPTDDAPPALLHAYAPPARGVGAPFCAEVTLPDINEESPYTLRQGLGFTLHNLALTRPEVGQLLGPVLEGRVKGGDATPRQKEAALIALAALAGGVQGLLSRASAASGQPLLPLLVDYIAGALPGGMSDAQRLEMVGMKIAILVLFTSQTELVLSDFPECVPKLVEATLDCVTGGLTLPREAGNALFTCTAYDLVYNLAQSPGLVEAVPNARQLLASFILRALARTLASPRGVDRVVITSALPCVGALAPLLVNEQLGILTECVDANTVAEVKGVLPNADPSQHTPLSALLEMVMGRYQRAHAAVQAGQILQAGGAHAAVRAMCRVVEAMGRDVAAYVAQLREVVGSLVKVWHDATASVTAGGAVPDIPHIEEKAELADSAVQLLTSLVDALGQAFDSTFGADQLAPLLLAMTAASPRAPPLYLRTSTSACLHALVLAQSQCVLSDVNAVLRGISADLKVDEDHTPTPPGFALAAITACIQPSLYPQLDLQVVMAAAQELNTLLPQAIKYATPLPNWRFVSANALGAVVAVVSYLATQDALRSDAVAWMGMVLDGQSVLAMAVEAPTDSRADALSHLGALVRMMPIIPPQVAPDAIRVALAQKIATLFEPTVVDPDMKAYVQQYRQQLMQQNVSIYAWQ